MNEQETFKHVVRLNKWPAHIHTLTLALTPTHTSQVDRAAWRDSGKPDCVMTESAQRN